LTVAKASYEKGVKRWTYGKAPKAALIGNIPVLMPRKDLKALEDFKCEALKTYGRCC
jgi:hypothetical protein